MANHGRLMTQAMHGCRSKKPCGLGMFNRRLARCERLACWLGLAMRVGHAGDAPICGSIYAGFHGLREGLCGGSRPVGPPPGGCLRGMDWQLVVNPRGATGHLTMGLVPRRRARFHRNRSAVRGHRPFCFAIGKLRFWLCKNAARTGCLKHSGKAQGCKTALMACKRCMSS